MRRLATIVLGAVLLAGVAKPARKEKLPVLGTQLAPLPEGKGHEVAEAVCLQCHSSDLLRQQRLTEKQWTAAVEKMIRWGAVVSDADKPALIAYLAKSFGPDNKAFTPVKTRPIGK